MSSLFGGGKKTETQTIVVSPPTPSPLETQAQQLSLDLLKKQSAQFDLAQQQQAAYEASPLAAIEKQVNEKAMTNLLNRLTGTAPVLSSEEQSRLDQIYATAQARGEEDLKKFAGEIAAQRGMTTADSPILAELLKQRRQFGEGLASQKAAASLDLGQAENLFNQQLTQFQSSLAQQAFLNRLQMAGMTQPSYGLATALGAQSLAAAPRTVTGSSVGGVNLFGNMTQGFGSLLGGAGGFLRGLGGYQYGNAANPYGGYPG